MTRPDTNSGSETIYLPPFPVIAKPKKDSPCNGCGWCCHEEICMVGKVFLELVDHDQMIPHYIKGPCPLMDFTDGKVRCGAVIAEQMGMTTEEYAAFALQCHVQDNGKRITLAKQINAPATEQPVECRTDTLEPVTDAELNHFKKRVMKTLLDDDRDDMVFVSRILTRLRLAEEKLRERESVNQKAITVWTCGSYRCWKEGDAKLAESDPDWFITVPLSEIEGES